MYSFTSVFQRFWQKSQSTYVALSGCFRILIIFRIPICLLGNFTAVIKLLKWLLNSLSKERCFHGNKYLDLHWDLWQFSLQRKKPEICYICEQGILKGALSGLRQYLANESSLKMMKNAFYFTLKALFVLKGSQLQVSKSPYMF